MGLQCAQWIPSALKHLFAVVSSLWRRRLRPPLLVVAIKSAMVGSWSSTDGPWSSTDGRWRVPLVKLSTDDREPASVHTTRAICGWLEVVCLRMAGGRLLADGRGGCLRMAGELSADGRGGCLRMAGELSADGRGGCLRIARGPPRMATRRPGWSTS